MGKSVGDMVLDETKRYREALPELLAKYAGLWIVFRDGKVDSVHTDERAAYVAGLERFGMDGGHIIVRVAEERPKPLNASVVFGIMQ
jgi:hypothetical protein